MKLKAFALNCSLKPSSSDQNSSTDRLLQETLAELRGHDCGGEIARAVDFDIRPGVMSDMGEGDEWPGLRERMEAFLSEADDRNRMPSYGRVALVAVVGNEDGAHHARMLRAENYPGFGP